MSIGRLTVFAAAPSCLGPIRSQLKPGDEGQVTFIVSRDHGAKEYEIELKGGYRLSAELAGDQGDRERGGCKVELRSAAAPHNGV